MEKDNGIACPNGYVYDKPVNVRYLDERKQTDFQQRQTALRAAAVGVFEYGGDFAAVAVGQGDDVHIAFVCRFNGFDDVGGIAGSGNADEDRNKRRGAPVC